MDFGRALERLEPPWESDRVALYSFLTDRSAHDRATGEDRLPDQDQIERELGDRPPGAPGELDVAYRRFPEVEPAASDRLALRVVKAIDSVLESPDAKTVSRLYVLITGRPAAYYADRLASRLASGGTDKGRLQQLARWLVTRAPDREPVKVGLRLLAMDPSADDLDLARTLGRHDEFTRLAAELVVAIGRDRDQELLSMGSQVRGHGRVAVVELLQGTRDPAGREWLLREGHRHTDLYNFQPALIAATTGRLADALAPGVVDENMLDSAGKLILDLINFELPSEMDAYPDAAVVCERYLDHVERADRHLEQAAVIDSIRLYVRRRDDWSPERREGLRERCLDLLSQDDWLPLIDAAEKFEDASAHHLVAVARDATQAGPWRRERLALRRDPLQPEVWSRLMASADQDTVFHAVGEAGWALHPVYVSADGLPEEHPAARVERCMSIVLEGLGRFPGVGTFLVQDAVHYPSHRQLAVQTLRRWWQEGWSDRYEEELRARAAGDPELRAAIEEAKVNT